MYGRYRFLIFAFFMILAPVVLYGAKQAWDGVSNRPADWLPEGFEETRKLLWFVDHFGSDEILMISWPGCTLDDRRLERLALELVKPVPQDERPAESLFARVFTGRQVLENLTEPPLQLPRKEALQRLEGWLISKDHRTSCLLALISEAGIRDRHAAVDWASECAESATGLSPEEIHMAGTTLDGVAIDRISKESLSLLTGVSLLVSIFLTYACFRSVRLTLMIFLTAIFSQQVSLALVYYSGAHMDSIMLMMASLVFVLAISSAVHMVNYYGDAIREHGLDDAPARAARHALLPCFLAAGTTALGLGSLGISQVIPISRFGLFSAAAVLLGFAVLFLLLPSTLQQWPARRWAARLSTADHKTQRPHGWTPLATFVARYHLAISLFAVIALVIVGWGATKLSSSVKLHDLFKGEVKILRDYDWIETNVGPLIPVEVVLHFPKTAEASLLDRLRVVERVRKAIDRMDDVGATISATTFAPRLSKEELRGARQVIEDIVLKNALQRHRSNFRELRYLQETDSEQLWRISLRVAAKDNVDYGDFLLQLQRCVDPILRQLAQQGDHVVTADLLGGIPLVDKAQRQLLDDLIHSFLVAFLLIALAMVVLLRSVVAGLVAMIPNLFPTAVIFGVLGWADFEIGIGSMMTASVALGIAVDDTLHFVIWFRRGLALGHSRREAVGHAYERCGTAMIQTSLICGLGLLVFSLSRFQPSAQFSWLMVTLLAMALLGDLLLLPAILIGPLGRAFQTPMRKAGK